MRKVSVRLPDHLVRAYDEAEGNRSAVMRRRLAEAVVEGEVDGVPADLMTLAERERAVEENELGRKRGTFRQRCYDFFANKWDGGAVTPDDADDLADSWRDEAAIYGPEYEAFVTAILDWYAENWAAYDDGAAFPTPGAFVARSGAAAATVAEAGTDASDRLVQHVAGAYDRGVPRGEAVAAIAEYHPEERARAAVEEVYDDD